MDVEFHYYMTYLIAKKARLSNKESKIVAHASQYVDDNTLTMRIQDKQGGVYENYISQTMNILQPKNKLSRIYPVFHFLPGNPRTSGCQRKDFMMHWLNTTPDSENANEVVDTAIKTADLYRIGIALHFYADTWAHQNYNGFLSDFNSMAGVVESLIPNIGHADAKHFPDWPALVWRDKRLLNERIDNKERFLAAASAMLKKLLGLNGKTTDKSFEELNAELRADLELCIGQADIKNNHKEDRIKRYQACSAKEAYGQEQLCEYDRAEWTQEAFGVGAAFFVEETMGAFGWDEWRDPHSWASDNYMESSWYLFQEAIKAHQKETLELLADEKKQGYRLWYEDAKEVNKTRLW